MILCSGCFDGLHEGHVRYLQAAHELSPEETLVVAVAPDAYILREKDRQPRWTQAQRSEVVLALAVVDAVIEHEDPSVARVIAEMKPAHFVKGEDWRDRLPADVMTACQTSGTVIHFVDTEGTHWGV